MITASCDLPEALAGAQLVMQAGDCHRMFRALHKCGIVRDNHHCVCLQYAAHWSLFEAYCLKNDHNSAAPFGPLQLQHKGVDVVIVRRKALHDTATVVLKSVTF